MIDGRLQHLALRAEPEAVIKQFGIFRHQLILQMRRAAIERDLFDAAMRDVQDGATRRFVHAARFHADEPVFQQIEPTNAMALAQLVQLPQQLRRAQPFAIDRHRIAALEIDGDIFRRIRRIFRVIGAAVDIIRHFFPRIFQHLALGRGVQQVGIGRERALAALVLRHRDLVLFGKGDQRFTAGQIPFPPRRDDADIGRQRIIAQLKPHLVIALARRPVGHGIGTRHLGNLDLALGNQRPRDRRAEQIQAFIQRVGAHHRKDIILHELFAQIVDEDILRLDAEQQCLGPRRLQLFTLTQIGGEGDDLALIFRLQPLQDHAGIQPARIGQHHLFDRISHRHSLALWLRAYLLSSRNASGGVTVADTPKTLPTDASVPAFLAALEPARRRDEAQAIAALLETVAGCPPVLWGSSIIGYGHYDYTYASGRTGTWPRLGFSPRKAQHVVYMMDGFDGQADLLAGLGKGTTGVSCLYFKKLADIDMDVLAEMARRSWAMMATRYPG